MNRLSKLQILSAAAITVFALAGDLPAAAGKMDAKKIAAVKAGKVKEAHAVWWGFSEKDATKCLQSALDSGAKKVIVDNVGKDWIVEPILLPSNIEVVFKNGVVVRAKKGSFKGRNDSLFTIFKKKNVTLTGEGKVLFTMNRKDYLDKKNYVSAEWRHTVSIRNSENVKVKNFTLTESGGDGVYVGSVLSRDIVLEDLICKNHHRQGISITGAVNLFVRNCKFLNTKGTPPQCGVDLEPNYPKPGLSNILFENCEFSDNAFSGIQFTDHSAVRVKAEFRNCVIARNKYGLNIGDLSSRVKASDPGKGYLRFINCKFIDNVDGNVFVGHHRPNIELTFKNCYIDNRKSREIAMIVSSRMEDDIDSLTIENLTVIDDAKRVPLSFVSRFNNALLKPVVKNIVLKDSKGKVTPFNIKSFVKKSAPDPVAKNFKTLYIEPQNVLPVSKKGVRSNHTIRYRQKSEHCLYAKAGQSIKIRFISTPVHRLFSKRYTSPYEVLMSSPTIRNIEKFYVPYDKDFTYTLHAKETGLYRFAINSKMQTVNIDCDAPGQGAMAAEPLYILWSGGEFYFAVPPGNAPIHVFANGTPKEPATVYLIDPNGKVADSMVNSIGSKILRGKKLSAKAEIWKLRFKADKLQLRLGAPCLPILSTSPENLIVPKNDVKLYTEEMIRKVKGNELTSYIRNGDFSQVKKGKDGKFYAEKWRTAKSNVRMENGKVVGLELNDAVYRYLTTPALGGKFVGKIKASGKGRFFVMFRTSITPLKTSRNKGKSKPQPFTMGRRIGPFDFDGGEKEISFPFQFREGEAGYIYILPAKGKLLLHSVKIHQA